MLLSHLTNNSLLCVSRLVKSDSLRLMDCSLPGSIVPGILQARMLEWVAISFSNSLLVSSNFQLVG